MKTWRGLKQINIDEVTSKTTIPLVYSNKYTWYIDLNSKCQRNISDLARYNNNINIQKILAW